MEKHALVEIIKTLDQGFDISFSKKQDVLFVKVSDPATNRHNQIGISAQELLRLTVGANFGLASTIEKCREQLRLPKAREELWRCDACLKLSGGLGACQNCGSNMC